MTELTTTPAQTAAEAAALRWRQGDAAAAGDLWDLCGSRMLRLARAILRDQAAAEDAVQEARRRAVASPPPVVSAGGALFEAVENLPPKLREAVALHHLMGFPVAECAQLLRLPEGTIKSRLFRARAALAQQGFGGNRHG